MSRGFQLSLNIKALTGVAQEHHAAILARGEHRQLALAEALFYQGETAKRCYLLISGQLKLLKLHEQGKEVIIRYIAPGELTAAVAVFEGKEYPVTAEAIGPSEVIGWDRSTMMQLMLEYPPLAQNILHTAVDQMNEMQDRYLELCAEQVEARLARALLRIMAQSGRKTRDGITIDFPLSRQELANYTGTSLYTVSRVLSTWERNGWIQSGRERITVTDSHALASFAEGA